MSYPQFLLPSAQGFWFCLCKFLSLNEHGLKGNGWEWLRWRGTPVWLVVQSSDPGSWNEGQNCKDARNIFRPLWSGLCFLRWNLAMLEEEPVVGAPSTQLYLPTCRIINGVCPYFPWGYLSSLVWGMVWIFVLSWEAEKSCILGLLIRSH